MALCDEIHAKKLEPVYPGNIKILSIKCTIVQFREDYQEHYKEFTHWLVCIFSHKEKVLATKATPHIIGTDPVVEFNEPFSFEDLPRDFVIDVKVFAMTAPNKLKMSAYKPKCDLYKVSYQHEFSTSVSREQKNE